MRSRRERNDKRNCDPAVLQRIHRRFVEWGVPESHAAKFLENYSMASFRKGALICKRGSPSDLLYWVCDGLVDILYPLDSGGKMSFRLSGPGDVLGPLNLLDASGHLTHAFEVRARTDCRVAFVTNERVRSSLIKLEPATLIELLKRVLVSWAEHAQHSTNFLAMGFQRRLQSIIADLASRFGVEEPHGVLLPINLGHQDLAAMIGSSRPIVTQLLAKMRRAGKIDQRGKYYILITHRKNRESGFDLQDS
jgi:CRP/FNR family cyclic AMP-dependent transcriptional regulator